jgi:hypothetical protein
MTMSTVSPADCALRAYRLLDPQLSEPAQERDQTEASWLVAMLLSREVIDEPRNAEEMTMSLLRRDGSPLAGLFSLARDLVEFDRGIPQSVDAALWHLVGRDLDTDITIAARLAWDYSPPPRGEAAPALSWPSVLSSEVFLLEEVLGRELVDGHVHLGGALPASFYWVAMMTGFAPLVRLGGWSRDPELWPGRVLAAIESRAKLVESVLEVDLSHSSGFSWSGADLPAEAFCDPVLSWLLPDAAERSGYNPVLGERYLLWKAFSRALRGYLDAGAESLLLSYLRCRDSVINKLIHGRELRGLQQFQDTFRRNHLLFADRVRGDRSSQRRRRRAARAILRLEQFRTRHALRYQFSDPTDAPWARDRGTGLARSAAPQTPWRPARRVELRVSPVLGPLQPRVIAAYLKGLADFVRHDHDAPPVRLGLIFHIHKGEDPSLTRDAGWWMLNGLFEMLRFIPSLRPFVVGIDAAGQEVLTAPRELAGIFRRLDRLVREQLILPGSPPIHLRRTFHAGEDFRDLLTGLRYVDEAVALLALRPGERIGHGLALALAPAEWYRVRSAVYPLKRDHVLDLLWGMHLARLADEHLGLEVDGKLEHFLSVALERLIGSSMMERALSLIEHFHDLERYDSESALLAELNVENWTAPIYLPVEPHYRTAVEQLRRRVLKRVERAQVVVEVCPTSNLLTSGLKAYERLPYLNLNRAHLPQSEALETFIPFSVNSDDPGMFQTTVTNEYRLLGEAMIRAGHARREVVLWLDEARIIGLASSFIPPWSPPTSEEILHAIAAVVGESPQRPAADP